MAAGELEPLKSARPHGRRPRYQPPPTVGTTTLSALIHGLRDLPENQQERLEFLAAGEAGPRLWYAGDLGLARRPGVAVVGTRQVSAAGAARARRLGQELAEAGVVVVSGLASGVDTIALQAAIAAGGQTIGVIGTSLERAYPIENAELQMSIYREHLLISQFAPGTDTHRGHFPARNRLMAALADATVIIEAADTSGTLHQAAECQRLGRWLFIAKSVVDDPKLTWPARFLDHPRTRVLTTTADVLSVVVPSG